MATQNPDGQVIGLEPLRTVRTNEIIQERLLQYIKAQELRPGDRLPSQQVLARSFGVSLVALREALRSLEALGILEVKVGAGWFIKSFSFDAIAKGLFFHTELNDTTLRDLHEIRICLETSYIVHATRTLTSEDIDELEQIALAIVTRAELGESWHDLDYQFHQKLFSSIRNQVFNKLMEIFWTLYGYLGVEIAPEESLSEARKHLPIVEAIRSGDEALAVQRMHESLKGSSRRIAGQEST